MKKLFLLFSVLAFLSNASFAQQKCPQTMIIQTLNKTGKAVSFYNDVLKQELADAFQKKFGDKLQVTMQTDMASAKSADFVLTATLTASGAPTFFEATLMDLQKIQLLGKINGTYTLPDFQALLRNDCKAGFVKFSAALEPLLKCQKVTAAAGDLCLFFNGKSVMTLKEPESGVKFDHISSNDGKSSLHLDPTTNNISGQGTMRQSTKANMVATHLPTSGAGNTGVKENPVTVTGTLVNSVAKLHVAGTVGQQFDFNAQVDGEQTSMPFASGPFSIDVEMPYYSGSQKNVSKVLPPPPGYDIKNSYNYDFTIKACPLGKP